MSSQPGVSGHGLESQLCIDYVSTLSPLLLDPQWVLCYLPVLLFGSKVDKEGNNCTIPYSHCEFTQGSITVGLNAKHHRTFKEAKENGHSSNTLLWTLLVGVNCQWYRVTYIHIYIYVYVVIYNRIYHMCVLRLAVMPTCWRLLWTQGRGGRTMKELVSLLKAAAKTSMYPVPLLRNRANHTHGIYLCPECSGNLLLCSGGFHSRAGVGSCEGSAYHREQLRRGSSCWVGRRWQLLFYRNMVYVTCT